MYRLLLQEPVESYDLTALKTLLHGGRSAVSGGL
jgi:hypothetical protein